MFINTDTHSLSLSLYLFFFIENLMINNKTIDRIKGFIRNTKKMGIALIFFG